MRRRAGHRQDIRSKSQIWAYLVLAGYFCFALAAAAKKQSFLSSTAKPPRPHEATVSGQPVPQHTVRSSQAAQEKPAGALPAAPQPAREPFQEMRGPFQLVAGQQSYTVVLHGVRLKWPESAHHKFDLDSDQSMQSFEIKDAAGQVLYQRTLDEKAENWSLEIGATLVAGKTDRAILVDWESLPSAPGSCSMYQFFGLVNGKFQPFGDAYCATLEFADNRSPLARSPVKLKEDPETHIEYFDSLFWTGNFHLVIPWRINFIVGKMLPTLWTVHRLEHPPACEVGVRADRIPQSEMTFLRLSREPGWRPQHVIVKPDSKVEFLSAAVPCHFGEYGLPNLDLSPDSLEHHLWLRVRVDGHEGWIHEQEDFEAIGLPQAG